MTDFKENLLKITRTVKGFPGNTSKWYSKNVEWLKNISLYGLELWLMHAERNGYVRSKLNSSNEIIYYATKDGMKEYKKHNPE